jgi:hypothetical protein
MVERLILVAKHARRLLGTTVYGDRFHLAASLAVTSQPLFVSRGWIDVIFEIIRVVAFNNPIELVGPMTTQEWLAVDKQR